MKELFTLNKYLWKYKYHLILGLLFVFISNYFGVIPAENIREAMDIVTAYLNNEVSREQMSDALWWAVFMVFASALLKGLFLFFMRQTLIVMSRLIEYDLKNQIYAHYQTLDYAFYKQNSTGDILNRIGEDVSRVRMYLGPGIMYTANLLVLFVLVISTMVYIHPMLTFYVLLPLPVLAVAIYFISEKINQKSEQVQKQLSQLSTHAQETFSGIRTIKTFVKENIFAEKYADQSNQYLEKSLSLGKTNAWFFPAMSLLMGLSSILAIYIGGKEVVAGNITYGNIAEFVLYINMLTWPVTSLGIITSIIQRASASQKRINAFLKRKAVVRSPKKAIVLKTIDSIVFDNVSLVYPESGICAVNNFNLNISAGQTLGIIGPIASGKSSLLVLLLRLLDPSSGRILINGYDIKDIDLIQFRKLLAYVPQDVFLFSSTIQENIQFGSILTVDEEAVIKASKKAALHEEILKFPDAYQTLIGERGVTLSGGQKQRLAIARAFVDPHKSLFIFDSCLSALDTVTEENILKNMQNKQTKQINILVSQRVSSLKNADKIIVLENGFLAAQGTHSELLQNNEIYASLYQNQLLEETKKEI